MDNRQAMRDRLFQIWFITYLNNEMFTMYNEQVRIDNIAYYASIILRKDHPLHSQVIEVFHEFVRDIPDKLDTINWNFSLTAVGKWHK